MRSLRRRKAWSVAVAKEQLIMRERGMVRLKARADVFRRFRARAL